MKTLPLLSILLLAGMCAKADVPPTYAQGDGVSGNTQGKTTIIDFRENTVPAGPFAYTGQGVMQQRGVTGVGSFSFAVFAPRYKERLNAYTEQIKMGLANGWLTQPQADDFSIEIERLRQLNADVATQNYAQPGLDNLEQQVTQFNIDLTNATNSPAVKTVKPTAPAQYPNNSHQALTPWQEQPITESATATQKSTAPPERVPVTIHASAPRTRRTASRYENQLY